jgi:hypothetical protein
MDPYDYLLKNFLGFPDEAERDIIRKNTFTDLEELRYVTEKDINAMVESFAKRAKTDGRVHFGLSRTQSMIGLMHWVQDRARCNSVIDVRQVNNSTFRQAIMNERERKSELDKMETHAKSSSPGKLKKESEWVDWLIRFRTYLSGIPGIIGVPLSYVIREEVTPDPTARYDSFRDRTIACSALEGSFFRADALQVHLYLQAFIQGESAEQWIKDKKKYQDGRLDVLTLKAHYGGVGNVTRRLADADHTYLNTFYKSEGALSFEKFLNRANDMWNIFEENGQPYVDSAKVRWLFQQVKSSDSAVTLCIASLKNDNRKPGEQPVS